MAQFARDLLAHLRQLLVIRTIGEVPDTFASPPPTPSGCVARPGRCPIWRWRGRSTRSSKALAEIREGDEPRMTVELALLRCARPALDPCREALAQRLERLEARLAGGPGPAMPSEASRGEPQRLASRAPRLAQLLGRTRDPTPDDAAPGTAADASPTRSRASPPREDGATVAGDGGREIDLERMVGLWPAVLDQVRESGSELLSQVLGAARPVAVDVEEAVLEVGFPASRPSTSERPRRRRRASASPRR